MIHFIVGDTGSSRCIYMYMVYLLVTLCMQSVEMGQHVCSMSSSSVLSYMYVYVFQPLPLYYRASQVICSEHCVICCLALAAVLLGVPACDTTCMCAMCRDGVLRSIGSGSVLLECCIMLFSPCHRMSEPPS